MRDAHHLAGGVHHQLVVVLCQGFDGLSAATGLGVGDDLALLIALQQGLDLQHGADQRHRAGHAPGLFQEHQIVHHEDLAHVAPQRQKPPGGFRQVQPGMLVFHRPHHQYALAQGRAQGVHQAEFPLGIAFPQLDHGHLGGLVGAGDARGHAHEQYVLPGLQQGLEVVDVCLGIDLAGGHAQAVAHGGIESRAVKGLRVHAGHLPAVDGVAEGDDGDVIRLEPRGRQVCGGIGDDGITHGYHSSQHIEYYAKKLQKTSDYGEHMEQ